MCHRGVWHSKEEKNTLLALKRSLELNYGFESDVRDYCGKLVISHDMADENSPALENVLNLLAETDDRYCFAINIKADGLVYPLKELLQHYGLKNYFTFDMSLPQMIWYKNAGLKFFTRQSEFEKIPLLYDEATGVWLDTFESDDWLTIELINKHLKNGKKVCIVSPELHGRAPQKLWSKLKPLKNPNLYICTDLSTEIKDFFGRCQC